jgi:hypothetical protein
MPQFRLWLIDEPSISFGQARLNEDEQLIGFLPSLTEEKKKGFSIEWEKEK